MRGGNSRGDLTRNLFWNPANRNQSRIVLELFDHSYDRKSLIITIQIWFRSNQSVNGNEFSNPTRDLTRNLFGIALIETKAAQPHFFTL